MSMLLRVFDQRLFNEHDIASTWSEALYEHDSASILPVTLS